MQGTDSSNISALSLPKDVLKEAETLWSKVVAALNSDTLQRQFFPLFAEKVTGICRSKGESYKFLYLYICFVASAALRSSHDNVALAWSACVDFILLEGILPEIVLLNRLRDKYMSTYTWKSCC